MKILDIVFRLPNLWNRWFAVFFIVGSAAVTVILHNMSDTALFLPSIWAITAVLFGGLAWFFMNSPATNDIDKTVCGTRSYNRSVWIFLGIGVLAAVLGLIQAGSTCLNWAVGVYSFVILGLWPLFFYRWRATRVIIGGVLLSSPFLLTAVMLSDFRTGLFPAVLMAMLSWVSLWIRDLEVTISKRTPDADMRIHLIYGKTLAWISTLLFIFGVISLWPWLGELYGQRYFWILVIGVLSPILFFWGRLRQPRTDDSKTALHRLCRILPYTGVILLLAFLFG